MSSSSKLYGRDSKSSNEIVASPFQALLNREGRFLYISITSANAGLGDSESVEYKGDVTAEMLIPSLWLKGEQSPPAGTMPQLQQSEGKVHVNVGQNSVQ